MWDWLRDILMPRGGIAGGNVDSINTLFGSPVSSGFDRNIQSPFINTPSPPSIKPPSGNSSFYDEGSRFRESRDQASRLNNPNQFPSMQDIMSRLQALGDPGRYMMDPGSLDRQARASASAQYDPVIAQLRQQMRSSESRAGRQKSELGQMFGQLSSSLEADIPELQQTFGETKQKTQGEYDELKGEISNTYSQTQADQEAMMKRLGIEAAAPDIFPEQMRDRDYFTNLANVEGQTQQSALGLEERGATEYTRRGTEQARTEGVQRQANLMDQLREVLDAYESQIGANEAAKSQAYTSALGQLSSQAQEQAMGFADRDFNNYLKTIQLGRDLRGDELQQLLKGQVTKVASPADVAGRALNLGFTNQGAQQLQDTFMDAIGSDQEIMSGLTTAGTAAPKESLAARVVERGRQQGLSQTQLNALHVMALEYFGRA